MAKRLKSKSGITLVELMSTVVVIGIISAMAAPSFDRAVQRIKFRSETKDLSSTLRLARSNAIADKVPCGVYFDGTNFTVTTFIDTADQANFNFTAGSDSVLKVDSLADEIVFLSATFTNTAVIFQPNGTASSSGDIYMISNDRGVIGISRLNVLAATGRTKMIYIHSY